MDEILQGKKFKCAFCAGTGIQPHSLKSRCFACRGKGEVEFESPAIACQSCKGKGKSPGALRLACIRCKGVGAVDPVRSQTTEPSAPPLAGTSNEVPKGEAADVLGERLGERLGEIMERLIWTREETEEKTKEIEKRLKPLKTFISARGGEVKKEIVWLEKLGDNLKKAWESLWKQ